MSIAWTIALVILAFVAGWFCAGMLHMSRAEDIYREGYSKGVKEQKPKADVPMPKASNW